MTSLQQQRKSVFTSVVESVTYYIEALNNSGVHTICCKSLFEFGFVGVGIVQTKKNPFQNSTEPIYYSPTVSK